MQSLINIVIPTSPLAKSLNRNISKHAYAHMQVEQRLPPLEDGFLVPDNDTSFYTPPPQRAMVAELRQELSLLSISSGPFFWLESSR